VRELENVISRGVLRAANRSEAGEPVIVRTGDLDPSAASPAAAVEDAELPDEQRSLRESVDDFQRRLILQAVERNRGNWSAAARELRVERANLHHLAKRLGLK